MKKQRTTTAEMLKEALTGKELAWALGGVGGAALENQQILPDLDPSLKNVNLGIGGTTGFLMANPAYRGAALASLPFKELGLFAVSSADKLRRQQQSLVDANLGVARTNQQTAILQRGNAASEGRRALAFLLPAILAGGGVGYMAYNQWKKNKTKNPRWQTTGTSGTPRGGKKIRIDVPASAVPPEFFHSLTQGEESPKAYTRFMEKEAPRESKEAQEILRKAATADQPSRFSIPRFLGESAWDMTGIPGAMNTAKEFGRAGGEYSTDNYGQAARYGAAGVGAALLALASARFGAGFAGNRLGRAFLHGQMGLTPGVRPGQFRNLVKPLLKWGPDYNATIASRNARYAYDPARYAWSSPTVGSRPLSASGDRFGQVVRPFFKDMLAERPFTGAPTIPRQMYDFARRGANRVWDTGYRAKQMFQRHPIMGPTLAGLPLAGMGAIHDERELANARAQYQTTPQWDRNRGPYNIPVSTVLSTMMGAFGNPDPRTRIQSQLGGAPWDPWAASR